MARTASGKDEADGGASLNPQIKRLLIVEKVVDRT
jgi:hypothetical protein